MRQKLENHLEDHILSSLDTECTIFEDDFLPPGSTGRAGGTGRTGLGRSTALEPHSGGGGVGCFFFHT